MLFLEELRSLGIETIWVLAHKEFLATKYVKRKALKHSKVFFMFLSKYLKDHVGRLVVYT